MRGLSRRRHEDNTPQGVQVGEVKIPAGEQQAEVNLEALPSGIIWVTDKKHGLPPVIIR